MKNICCLCFLLFICFSCGHDEKSFLIAEGGKIVKGGDEIILRGIGLGGWMLQEPYMLCFSEVAVAQYDIRNKLETLIGKERTEEFYSAWLANMITESDIDSLRVWGFNSIRLPMHYNLFTLPTELETDNPSNTWLDKGFLLTDSLLKWCADNRIYLILDLHAAPGGQGNDKPIADVDTLKANLWQSEANRKKTVELWRKLAMRYKDEEWIGGYDLINETNYPLEGNTALRELMKDITDAIRETDKNHLIFIEGNRFANDFTGLTPPWDDNMAYSFHKYWTPTTGESIQPFIDIRNEYSVPLWMGESGENNNDWYRSAVELFESNNIGWAWWTIKKLESSSGIMTVKTPEGYNDIIEYWAGKAPAPDPQKAYETLMQLTENIKIGNCGINYPVINALLAR